MLRSLAIFAAVGGLLAAAPGLAQIQTVDPNQAYSGQASPLDTGQMPEDSASAPAPDQDSPSEWNAPDDVSDEAAPGFEDNVTSEPRDTRASDVPIAPAPGATVPREDVFTAAEGVFGRGARGLAGILEDILREQGEPTAYIAGQEASGAFVVGVRYGSGTMHHQIEGDRMVYWTGPSIGFDVGADANKVFVLVYNLHDSQDLFKRFPGAEGHAYFVGGFNAQYMRRGDVVLIPVRLGVGLRLGVNAGYMRFSERNRWLPF